jgi:hypothetical protein
MANVRSDLMASILAGTKLDVSLGRLAVYFQKATTAVLAADADGTFYPVMRLPAHARIIQVYVGNDAITGGTDYDLGLYVSGPWDAADQTVKDKDIYADGISMATARNTFVHNDTAGAVEASLGSRGVILGAVVGGGAITGLNWARQVWQDAGDSAAPTPGTTYDLAWTANTVGTGAGTIVTGILYGVGQ